MPIFAALFASISGGFAALMSTIMAYKMALKLTAYTTWIALTVSFLAAMFVCVNSLWIAATAYFSGGGSISTVGGAIAIGLGVLIPANAGVVLSCCSSVWLGTQVYKLQKQGIVNFAS